MNVQLKMNLEILYDDREVSIGKKLSDNDLIGIPDQIIIGKRDLKENLVEFKERKTYESKKINKDFQNYFYNLLYPLLYQLFLLYLSYIDALF